jgi:hypothetical protein
MRIACAPPILRLIGNRSQSIARPFGAYDAEAIRPGTAWLN